ncbi:winged helix-turn-helix domain-containing protein [Halobacteriaceae archaeon SHR40]|uniref:helix-turn-helix domain-containing protein n=1 Tax=Halovenus amylolytica TaxID=2500550 RepID=UPI000FE2C7EF
MGPGPEGDGDQLELASVLDALNDESCRQIVEALSEPMTAEEISEVTDIPLSTTYRKLDRLTDAGLLEEGVEVRKDGQHVSRYILVFDEVSIGLSDDRKLELDLSRRETTADERLAALWTEVRKET